MVDQQEAIVVENNLQNVDNILLLFKGKTRTKRPRSPSSPLPFTTTMSTTTTTTTSASADDSEAAVSTEEKQEEEDMARCLILLAQGSNQLNTNNSKVNNGITSSLYECKTCNRSFPSFQALGGHRASHKKPKLLNNDHDNVCLTLQMSNNSTTSSTSTHNTNTTSIYTNTNSNNNNNNIHNNNNHVITKVMKVHECGTCGAEFSSGQALGGHMRRHRPIGGAVKAVSPVEKTVVAAAAAARSNVMTLDLNLPAPEEEQMQRHFVFPSNDKTLVFTASSLVDCHY